VTSVTKRDDGAEVVLSVNDRDTLAPLEAAIAAVRARVGDACARAGRRPEEIRLVGVTKGVASDLVGLAARAGLQDFGENYVQELDEKRAAAPDAVWHFIGRLQRNKIRRVVELADVVHTLEPGPAVERLARVADEAGTRVDSLIEVDFTGRRVGVPPEELEAFADRLDTERIRLLGLMTIAPQEGDPRRSFARLRELRDGLTARFDGTGELSMGMSADLEEAVEEGATMVRVGTAIFGPRARR
jgi:pyridoxal phosphate enzyme (YggS family)